MNVGRHVHLLSAIIMAVALFVPLQTAGEGQHAGTRGSDTLGTWTEFRGNLNNTGYSTSDVPPTNHSILKFTTGWAFHSSPVISTDILYFGSDNGRMYAVNMATGIEIWNYSTMSEVWATPLVVGNTVYVGSMDSNLYALNRMTGARQWLFTANDSIVSSAKYHDGTIIFSSQDGNVYFIDATTGLQVIPPFSTSGQIWGTPAIADETAVVGSNDGNVSRIRLSDGSEVWNFTLASSPSGFVKYSSAAVQSGRVFIGSDDRYAYALDFETGAEIWRFQTGNFVYATPGVHENRVFIHSTDGDLYAIPFDDPNLDGEITSNEIIWQFHTGDGLGGEGGSSPAIADGKVLVAARTGYLYCINESTGQEIWNFSAAPANRPSFSSPTVVDGRVFVGLSDGSMYGFGRSAPGMSIEIVPAMTVIESQRAMEIVFNVTSGGMPVEGAFISFTVSAGTLSQNGASTLADGRQVVKYLAPQVNENTTVRITAKVTKYGMNETSASIFITVVPAHEYGTTSGTAFSLEKYSTLLVAIGALAVANIVVYLAITLKLTRRSRGEE